MMNTDQASGLEGMLAVLMRQGTRLAALVIGIGIAVALVGPATSFDRASLAMHIVSGGLLLVIVLPVTRVALMLAAFLISRDYAFAITAACVLLIIVLGVVSACL